MNVQLLGKECVDVGRVMQLATSVNNQPWVCNVYYVSYEDKLYWLSFPSRRHSQEIVANNKVAATIMIKPERPTIGVQLAGVAAVVEDMQTVQQVMICYIEKYGEGEKFYENFKNGTNKHVMYAITIKELVLFDEVQFPHQGRQVVL